MKCSSFYVISMNPSNPHCHSVSWDKTKKKILLPCKKHKIMQQGQFLKGCHAFFGKDCLAQSSPISHLILPRSLSSRCFSVPLVSVRYNQSVFFSCFHMHASLCSVQQAANEGNIIKSHIKKLCISRIPRQKTNRMSLLYRVVLTPRQGWLCPASVKTTLVLGSARHIHDEDVVCVIQTGLISVAMVAMAASSVRRRWQSSYRCQRRLLPSRQRFTA